jgi:alpha-1,6-mannosyltransferase
MSRLRVMVCGVVIGTAFVMLHHLTPRDGSPLFLWILALVSVAYLLVVRELFRQRFPSRTILLCGLALALLWRIPLAVAPVGRSGDAYRYIWDARVQRAGHNPYVARANDPALAWIHTPSTRRMNNQDVPSPYPPVAQLYFRGVTALHESAEALKISLVVCEGLLVLVLWRWLVMRGLNPAWVLAYAWHPLATLEISRNGHYDVLGALLICLSALALLRGRPARAAVWFALAVGAKLLPVVLAPLYWKRVRPRDALLGTGVLLAIWAPFAQGGVPQPGSIPDVIDRFRFNAPLFEWGEAAIGAWGAAGLALAAGFAVSLACRRWDAARTPAVWAWPLAAALAFSPLVYPWYLVWLLPFLTSAAVLPLTVWSLSIIPTYSVWRWFTEGAPWRVPDAMLLLEYGPPIVVAAYCAWEVRGRASRRSGSGT